MQNEIDRLIARLDEIEANKKSLEALLRAVDDAGGLTIDAGGLTIDLWIGPKREYDEYNDPVNADLSMSFSTHLKGVLDNLLLALEDDRLLNTYLLERQIVECQASIAKGEARLPKKA